MDQILDEFFVKINFEYGTLLERRIRLVVKERPPWMPNFAYKKIVRLLFEIQDIR